MAKKDTIDFTGVAKEIGSRDVRLEPGEYQFKIVAVEKKWKDNDKTNVPYYNWKLQVSNGSNKGATKFYTTSLKTESLWSLRNFIHAALGKNVAGKQISFDPQSLVGKSLVGTVEDQQYERDGQTRMSSRIVDVQPLKDEDDEDEEEEEDEEEGDEELEDVDLDEI